MTATQTATGKTYFLFSAYLIINAANSPVSKKYNKNSTSPLNTKQPIILTKQFKSNATLLLINNDTNIGNTLNGINVKYGTSLITLNNNTTIIYIVKSITISFFFRLCHFLLLE